MNPLSRPPLSSAAAVLLGLALILIPASSAFPQKKASAKKRPAREVTMEVNTAVMVTIEESFGNPAPSIAEALKMMERRSKPDDGSGRTFAILDAYGERMPDGRLHISMHVSSEKPGLASIIHRGTGKTLWQTRILRPKDKRPAFTGKNLMIMMDNGEGRAFTIDGSTNPSSILTATVKELEKKVQDVWPNGEEREFTFIYSACGCPVHVLVKRIGDRTVRTKEMPVIFPDDPAVAALIARLMRWQ